MAANAYLGAKPIADAFLQGAQIVITGRVADPSLTVGPCVAHYGWPADAYDKIAGATIAGHLIECGTQVTGRPAYPHTGLRLKILPTSDSPIVEIDENGHCIVTKPFGTSGRVDIPNVKEQLLYEIGDPEQYLSPDATVSFLSLALEEVGQTAFP